MEMGSLGIWDDDLRVCHTTWYRFVMVIGLEFELEPLPICPIAEDHLVPTRSTRSLQMSSENPSGSLTDSLVKRLAGPSSGKAGSVRTISTRLWRTHALTDSQKTRQKSIVSFPRSPRAQSSMRYVLSSNILCVWI